MHYSPARTIGLDKLLTYIINCAVASALTVLTACSSIRESDVLPVQNISQLSVASDNTVYAVAGGKLAAFDAKLNELWRFEPGRGDVDSAPQRAPNSDTTYVMCAKAVPKEGYDFWQQFTLVALDKGGQELWRHEILHDGVSGGDNGNYFVLLGGQMVIIGLEDRFYNADDQGHDRYGLLAVSGAGKQLWSMETHYRAHSFQLLSSGLIAFEAHNKDEAGSHWFVGAVNQQGQQAWLREMDFDDQPDPLAGEPEYYLSFGGERQYDAAGRLVLITEPNWNGYVVRKVSPNGLVWESTEHGELYGLPAYQDVYAPPDDGVRFMRLAAVKPDGNALVVFNRRSASTSYPGWSLGYRFIGELTPWGEWRWELPFTGNHDTVSCGTNGCTYYAVPQHSEIYFDGQSSINNNNELPQLVCIDNFGRVIADRSISF